MDRHIERDLRNDSDDLLAELNELRALEAQKRNREISSPEFHELADAIEEKSREIFRTAADERYVGNEADRHRGTTINDLEP